MASGAFSLFSSISSAPSSSISRLAAFHSIEEMRVSVAEPSFQTSATFCEASGSGGRGVAFVCDASFDFERGDLEGVWEGGADCFGLSPD